MEVAVQVAQRWILARLRHERFFSLAALNARIHELTLARADGTYLRLLTKLARATILTSQVPVAQWHTFIGDPSPG